MYVSSFPNYEWTKALRHREELKDDAALVFSFKPNPSTALSGSPVNRLFEQYTTVQSKRMKSPSAHKRALSVALNALASCCESDDRNTAKEAITGFLYPATTATPKAPPQRYRRAKQTPSHKALLEALEGLKSMGHIVMHKGFQGGYSTLSGVPRGTAKKGLVSLWMPTAKFRAWYVQARPELRTIELDCEQELVILKGHDGKLCDYPETPSTMAMRNAVHSTNEARNGHKWDYIPQSGPESKGGAIEARTRLTEADLTCRRIFTKDLEQHGRFYCPAQNLPKRVRATIRVDGKETVELDYNGLHPQILFHQYGLEAPSCPYGGLQGTARDKVKRATLCALNATSEQVAVRALTSALNCSHGEVEELLECVKKNLHAIRLELFTGASLRLMNIDSRIAERILLTCAGRGIPVLPIHDSFRTPCEYGPELKIIMESVYQVIVGTTHQVQLSALKPANESPTEGQSWAA